MRYVIWANSGLPLEKKKIDSNLCNLKIIRF